MKNYDFHENVERIVKFREDRDWSQFHTPKDMAISLVLESTELLEHFQWKKEDEVKVHLDQRREEVAEELADVLYWVLLISNDLKIDLNDTLSKKMDKNEAKYPIEKAKGNAKKYTELED